MTPHVRGSDETPHLRRLFICVPFQLACPCCAQPPACAIRMRRPLPPFSPSFLRARGHTFFFQSGAWSERGSTSVLRSSQKCR